jgi:hypothetical protein
MVTVRAAVFVQAPTPLQLLLWLWLNEKEVLLVCAYAIGDITANVTAAIAPTARIVAMIGTSLFIMALL